MRTETEEIRDNLKYLSLLARDYPSQAAAAQRRSSAHRHCSSCPSTEHFMSDLHGENEAFVHILNSASGVIREKVDIVLGDTVPEGTRAELATLIYYPNEKLPQLKERCADEEALEQCTVRRCCGSSTSAASSLPSTPGACPGLPAVQLRLHSG